MTARWRNRNNAPSAKPSVPENVVFEADIAYREGNEKWKLDLARPKAKSTTPQPAIVFIHGGGWASGDKGGGQWRSLPLEYAARGYVCVSINYRLTNEGIMLDCIADCKCAVRWLRANAEKYNIDSKRIGAYGNSAGAHLVSVLGLAPREADLEGDGPHQDVSSLVQAVCCSAPPTDFTNWLNPAKNPRSPASRLFGDKDAETVARRCSPVTYASDKAPPFLIVHGTADKTVPVSQGDALGESTYRQGSQRRNLHKDRRRRPRRVWATPREDPPRHARVLRPSVKGKRRVTLPRACVPLRTRARLGYCFFGIQVIRPQFILRGTTGSSFSPDLDSITIFGPPLWGSGKARVTNPSGDHVGSSPRPDFRRCFPSLLTTHT